jgi:acetyl-CoA carboxylase carboxyltransferase component
VIGPNVVKTVTQEEVTQEVGFGIIATMKREGFYCFIHIKILALSIRR